MTWRLNSTDDTGDLKFTYDSETNKSMIWEFISGKTRAVHRKPTHTDHSCYGQTISSINPTQPHQHNKDKKDNQEEENTHQECFHLMPILWMGHKQMKTGGQEKLKQRGKEKEKYKNNTWKKAWSHFNTPGGTRNLQGVIKNHHITPPVKPHTKPVRPKRPSEKIQIQHHFWNPMPIMRYNLYWKNFRYTEKDSKKILKRKQLDMHSFPTHSEKVWGSLDQLVSKAKYVVKEFIQLTYEI